MKPLIISRYVKRNCFVEVKSNATGYQETLLQTELLLLISTERKDRKTIFQQDNAPTHTATTIKISE